MSYVYKYTIVDVNSILNESQMVVEKFNLRDLVLIFTDKVKSLEWLASRGLIHNCSPCERCPSNMYLSLNSSSVDAYNWRCKHCRKSKSVRYESIFSNGRLSLEQMMIIVYCWTKLFSQCDIKTEAGLGLDASHTIIDWCLFCRTICKQHNSRNSEAIGGLDSVTLLPKTVEIDESKFSHDRWVFGGIERDCGRCFLVEIPDRTEKTLLPLIERYILPGTRIISDDRDAYKDIKNIGDGIYSHHIVVNEKRFVDPDNKDIHTQHVVNMWMQLKRKLRRQFGTSKDQFGSYLAEFVWRQKMQENPFMNFLICIKEQYILRRNITY